MLPDGWKEKSFGDVVNVANGLIDPREASFKNTKHIGPENVISDTGRIVNERTCGDLKLISGKYQFDKNSIVYSKIRPNLNKVCAPSYSGVCSADMYVLRPREEIDKNFLFFIILDDSFKNRAISMSMRTGMPKINRAISMSMRTGMPKINREDLSSIPLLLPPLSEQKKIAAILSTWDRAIEGTEKLLANSQQQKKALMQQLLTGKKRLPGFTGEWKTKYLGDIADIQTGSSNRQDSLTNGEYTFFDRSEDIRTSNRYLFDCEAVIVPGEGQDFVPKYFVGKFDLHQRTYAISCFQACDGKFIFYTVGYHRSHFLSQAVGSTVKSLRLPMFQKMPLKLPPLSEQRAIAAVLSTADEELAAIEADLALLRQEKKALMQQLLMGKRRVTVD